jgi:hypothetical protein
MKQMSKCYVSFITFDFELVNSIQNYMQIAHLTMSYEVFFKELI